MAFTRRLISWVLSAVLFFAGMTAVIALVWYNRPAKNRQAAPVSTLTKAQPPEAIEPPPPPDDGWVGSQKCAQCHLGIWESYQTHPMSQSAARVLEAPIVEDYTRQTSFSQPASRTYRVERTPEHVWHHESMTDAAGEVLYDQAVEIDYAIGSGKRGRSYLIDRGGLLKVSPITWYTQGERWNLSPGYQPRTHQRFDRRAIDGCLVCHVGRLSFERDRPDRFGKPPLMEPSIGCERCHGPGREHVRWHESAEVAAAGADPIVNPLRLEPGAREDVCNQCHLVGGERLLRYGRTEYDFRPGQRLDDIWTVFAKGRGAQQGATLRAVGQVDQMRESVCFRQSQGRLGCLSCHDPHSSPSSADREKFYDNRCAACHRDKGCSLSPAERSAAPAAGSCIACHMRPLPASNVPHTSQTDHRILRRPNSAASGRAAGEMELFDDAESRLPRLDLDRARGLKQAEQLLRRSAAVSAAQLEAQLRTVLDRYPADTEVLLTLGSLCMLQQHPGEAEASWLAALRLRPEHEEVLQRMAQFERERGNIPAAIGYLQRYQAIDPWRADFHGLLAQLLWSENRRDEALAAALQGLKLDPRLVPLRKWLAQAYRQLGRGADADQEEQMIQRMQDR